MPEISSMKKIIAIFFLLLLFGCTQKPLETQAAQAQKTRTVITMNETAPMANGTPFLKGVSLSPKSFQQQDFTDFFAKAKQAGSTVSWAGDWDELGTQGGGPEVVTGLSSSYDYVPLVEAQFFTQSDGKLLRPLNDSVKKAYKESAAAFAGKYKPEYLAFGIEVNTLYEKSPGDFESFAQFYDEVYDAVKAASPNTKVFTIFQLEKMKGMGGGLFGGTNDPSRAEWQLLDRFPKSDIIAFTTYPDLIYKSPDEIPEDYYVEIRTHTSKPIAFTEIGWHSVASPQGWESNESEQADFIGVFFNRTSGLRPEFGIWSFLYDQNTTEPFNSMGLYRADGTPKKAWEAWKRETGN